METEINQNHAKLTWVARKLVALNGIFALLSLSFCVGCFSFISDYDAYTYRSLTELKGEMRIAFEEFGKKGASGEDDQKTLQAFLIRMSQALEYEKGKSLNDDTIAQFEILEDKIRDVVKRFESGGSKLSPGYARAKWGILEKAFDIAIETERKKLNKNR